MNDEFPIAIRSKVPLAPTVEKRVRKKLARRIGHAAPLVKRGTIRFEDINGPRGGVDKECRIKLVLSGRPSVQASDRGTSVEPAFERASTKVVQALARVRGKHALKAGRPRTPRPHAPRSVTITVAPRVRLDRKPMKLETARKPPSRRAIKTKARRAKRRVGVQRARSR